MEADKRIRHANDKTWDVIWFIALNTFSAKPVTSSDVYLGTGLPKRTVIRILEKLENLNVIKKIPGPDDARVRMINFGPQFAAEIDRHLQECITEGI
ncbi:MAG: MarR family transcriptional regulator [Rhodospirillales bacterium]|nr:MarR family transcriptional regulator [Rhodospirillales bacterium]